MKSSLRSARRSAGVRIIGSAIATRISRSWATMSPIPQRCKTPSGAAYAVAGAGDPLVLIHGVGMRLEAWTPQIEALSKRFEVIAVDLPGHGESRPFPSARRSRIS
ncbi:alpha/beta fold hydrolase [Rhizobium sp. G21]|uniref:alpha/beta fold hydrolase n=1 Tax=Rhizobium sp. G21 TaxID=2758439 RepID=UPI0028B17966|nr:alpha/beta fold hydrolase [Rhizobium sp. G21]